MTVQVATIGTTDLLASPYTLESYSLPDATLSDFGRSAQLAGAYPYEAHYEPPAFELVVIVHDPTRDAIDDLYTAFAPGESFIFGDETGSGTAHILTATCSTLDVYSSFARVLVTGTRLPSWETSTTHFTDTSITGTGTYAFTNIGGQVAAKLSLRITNAGSTDLLAVGIQPSPKSLYDPIDDYSGQVVSGAYGGEMSTDVTLTTNYQNLGTAQSVDTDANRGTHLAIARLKTTATTPANTSYRVVSSTDGATSHYGVPYTAAAATRTIPLGVVRVPVAELPTAWPVWQSATAITQSGGSARTFPYISVIERSGIPGIPVTWTYYYDVTQSFTLAARRRINTASVKVTSPGSASITCDLFAADANGAPTGGLLARSVTSTVGAETAVLDFPLMYDAASGPYALVFRATAETDPPDQLQFWRDTSDSAYSGGVAGHYSPGGKGKSGVWVAGDGTDTTVDLTFSVTLDEYVAFDSDTPVQAICSESSKAGAIDFLVRVPMDHGGFSVTGSFGASAGVFFDADSKQVYPSDTVKITGTALSTMTPFGTEFALPPGNSTLVVCSNSINTVTLAGTIIERRISRG